MNHPSTYLFQNRLNSRSRFRFLVAFYTCMLSCCFGLQSAKGQDTLRQNLREVNIIASSFEKELIETPRSVTVLTEEDLVSTPYFTLGDLLQQQAGIYIVGSGQAPGSNQSIFMRGTNSNQTAIFIDGVRIQDISTVNGVVDLSELPLNDIVRVEILRGAEGTLYGSPAAGGVIRISTRRSLMLPGIHGRVSAQGGVFHKGGKDASSGIRLDYQSASGFSIQSSIDGVTSGGFNATVDTGIHLPGYESEPDAWNRLAGGIRAAYKKDQIDFYLDYRRLNSHTDIDAAAYQDDDNYQLDFKRNTFSTGLKKKFSPAFDIAFLSSWTASARSAVNDSSINPYSGINDRSYYTEDYTGEQLTGQTELHYQGKGFNLTAGFNGTLDQMNQKNRVYSALYDPFIYDVESDLDSISPEALTTSAYWHADLDGSIIRPSLKSWHVLTGMRWSRHSIYGNVLSFDLSPSFRISEDALVYASISSGFTHPSLYQLYAPDTYTPWDGSQPTNLTRGNKDLAPEYTLSFEVGFKEIIDENTSWNFNLFRTVTRNVIDYAYVWDAAVALDVLGTDPNRDDYRGDRYINTGEQLAYGIELGITRDLSEQVRIEMTATLLDGHTVVGDFSSDSLVQYQLYSNGVFLADEATLEGLVRRPSTVGLSLQYSPTDKLSGNLRLQYTGIRSDVYYDSRLGPYGALNTKPVSAYTLVHASLDYHPDAHWRVTLRLENLLNVDYQEIYGFSSRGRGLQVGVAYHF